MEVVAKLLLLQVLLGQVLEVSLGERKLSVDNNLSLVDIHRHLGAKVSSLAVDLDALTEEVFEGTGIEDLVLHRGRAVNGELDGGFLDRLLGFLQRILVYYTK